MHKQMGVLTYLYKKPPEGGFLYGRDGLAA